MNFFTVLGILFIGLKLAGIIAWPWWQVTLPLWGGFLVVFAFAFVVACLNVITDSSDPTWRPQSRR